jgi:hypothetical protein
MLNDTTDDLAAAQCKVMNDDLFIAPTQTGHVSLDGLIIVGNKNTGGGFHAFNNSQISSISSNSLQLSGAWIQFQNISSLSTLSFPQLYWIGVQLSLIDLPMLEELQFGPVVNVGGLPIPVTVNGGYIANTALSKIEGLFAGAPHDIYIMDNPNLRIMNLLPTQILIQPSKSYTGNLEIVNNSAGVRVDLPNLFSVDGTITIRDCSELSIPSLGVVNGSVEIFNAGFTSLSAPTLEKINGDLNITGSFSGYHRLVS